MPSIAFGVRPFHPLVAHTCAAYRVTKACRATVLSTIDMARAKGLKGEQMNQTIAKAVRDYMPATPTGLRKDVYSHFILRLAYCRRCACALGAANCRCQVSFLSISQSRIVCFSPKHALQPVSPYDYPPTVRISEGGSCKTRRSCSNIGSYSIKTWTI